MHGCESTSVDDLKVSVSCEIVEKLERPGVSRHGVMEADAELRAELTTFQSKECYVYRPPPASSIGHRAELWDVDHWLQVSATFVPRSFSGGNILASIADCGCRRLA